MIDDHGYSGLCSSSNDNRRTSIVQNSQPGNRRSNMSIEA